MVTRNNRGSYRTCLLFGQTRGQSASETPSRPFEEERGWKVSCTQTQGTENVSDDIDAFADINFELDQEQDRMIRNHLGVPPHLKCRKRHIHLGLGKVQTFIETLRDILTGM